MNTTTSGYNSPHISGGYSSTSSRELDTCCNVTSITTVSGGYSRVMCPKIESISWGKIEVANYGVFKDAIVSFDSVEEWNWDIYGTNHQDGVQPEEVERLLKGRATHIVLSTGMEGGLSINPKTIQLLKSSEYKHTNFPSMVSPIEFFIGQTELAVEKYNEWREWASVAGLFHTTR